MEGKKTRKETRSKRVNARFKPTEFQQLCGLAKDAKMSYSAFLRQVVLNAITHAKSPAA